VLYVRILRRKEAERLREAAEREKVPEAQKAEKIPVAGRVEAALAMVCAALVIGAGISAFWGRFASRLTEHGNGEPLVMLEGVSVWPTVLLRMLGIALAIYFIWAAQRSLNQNMIEISREVDNPGKQNTIDQLPVTDSKPTQEMFYKPIVRLANRSMATIKESFDMFLSIDRNQNSSLKIKPMWDAYRRQETFAHRFCRVIAYIAIMGLIGVFVILSMFGGASVPVRGHLAHTWYVWTMLLDYVFTQAVIFFVFDATLCCFLFIKKLCQDRRNRSEWPQEMANRFGVHLRLYGDPIIHDWIDVKFVAQRTRCVGSIVYYPFILIVLFVVSGSTIFANFAPDPTILILQGISLSFVFASSIMLWWAATTVRDATKQNLMERIISAKGQSADGRAKGGKAPNDSERYAEQLQALLNGVEQLKDGAFRPILQQPLVQAVLWSLSSFGGVSLIEKGIFLGL